MKAADQLFDPRTYNSTRLDVMESETLPAFVYTSDEIYEREVEHIFNKDWYVVGDATRIPNPGDFFTVELCGKSIIIVRGEDGVVRAFVNACRHRGMEIATGEGNVDRFACPYHSWVYALDGTLLHSMEMQNTRWFDEQNFGLVPVRLESWGIFLFINLDHEAVSLAQRLGDLPERFELYDFDDLVCARHKVWEVACNWKLLLENGMEELHVGTVHQKTIQQYAPASIFERLDPTGEYGILRGKTKRTIALLKGETGFPAIRSPSGKSPDATHFVLLYPSSIFVFTTDCIWYGQRWPMGPSKTRYESAAYFPSSTVARPDFAEVVPRYHDRLEKTYLEDIEAMECQQRGLRSAGNMRGRFSYREKLVHDIANWWLDRMFGSSDAAPASYANSVTNDAARQS